MCGSLRLAFSWDVTARSLMSLMLKALEHVLQQRREILCMLSPISPYTAITWSSPGSSAASTATLQVSMTASCLCTLAASFLPLLAAAAAAAVTAAASSQECSACRSMLFHRDDSADCRRENAHSAQL